MHDSVRCLCGSGDDRWRSLHFPAPVGTFSGAGGCRRKHAAGFLPDDLPSARLFRRQASSARHGRPNARRHPASGSTTHVGEAAGKNGAVAATM
jgi:hypothetical protein